MKQATVAPPVSPRPFPGLVHNLLVYGLFFILLGLPWFNLSYVGTALTSHFFLVIWALTALFLIILFAYFQGDIEIPVSASFIILGLWFGVRALAGYFSLSPHRSLWGDYTSWTDGLIYMFLTFVLFFLVLMMKLKPREIKTILHLFLGQSIIIGGLVWYEAYQRGGLEQIVRPYSIFNNSDYFIAYGLLVLPIALALFIAGLKHWRERKPSLALGFYGLQILIVGVALYLSLPAWVKTSVNVTDSQPQDVSQVLTTPSNSERLQEWKMGLAIGKRNWLLGSGPGATRDGFYLLQQADSFPDWTSNLVMNRPHNEAIEQFSQSGGLGLLFYLIVWVGGAFLLWRHRKNIPQEMFPYAIGLASGLILLFLFNQFLFTLIYTGYLTWVWIALLMVLTLSPNYLAVKQTPIAGKIGMIVLALSLVTTSYWALRYLQAEQQAGLALGAALQTKFKEARDYSERAVKSYPYDGYYTSVATTVRMEEYINPKTSAEEKPGLGEQMVMYAHKTVELEPYKPLNTVNKGAADYLVSPKGSEAEKQAISTIDRGAALGKGQFYPYLRAGQAFLAKEDYQRALEYFKQAKTLRLQDRFMLTIDTYLAQLEAKGYK